MIDPDLVHALTAYFFRSLGALCLLPLGEGATGFTRHVILSAGTALVLAAGEGAHPRGEAAVALEFFTGLIIGLPAALAVDALKSLGELFDTGRGQTLGVFYDPQSGAHSSHTALLAEKLGMALILGAGILEEILIALAAPRAEMSLASLSTQAGNVLRFVTFTAAGTLASFVVFSVIFLIADLLTAVAARTMPGSSLLGEAFQLKTYAGIAALLVFIQFNPAAVLIGAARPRLNLLIG